MVYDAKARYASSPAARKRRAPSIAPPAPHGVGGSRNNRSRMLLWLEMDLVPATPASVAAATTAAATAASTITASNYCCRCSLDNHKYHDD